MKFLFLLFIVSCSSCALAASLSLPPLTPQQPTCYWIYFEKRIVLAPFLDVLVLGKLENIALLLDN